MINKPGIWTRFRLAFKAFWNVLKFGDVPIECFWLQDNAPNIIQVSVDIMNRRILSETDSARISLDPAFSARTSVTR